MAVEDVVVLAVWLLVSEQPTKEPRARATRQHRIRFFISVE
jgi:hypothetical protein